MGRLREVRDNGILVEEEDQLWFYEMSAEQLADMHQKLRAAQDAALRAAGVEIEELVLAPTVLRATKVGT